MDDLAVLKKVIEKDTRYSLNAYLFIFEAIFYTRKKFRVDGHVTGRQLLEGIKDLAQKRYGLMAKAVFEHWGITKTLDFGNIVFNMVNEKILGKTEEDRLDDFNDVYDFDEVFVKNYPLQVNIVHDVEN